jgi:hypothetical protein
MPLKHLVSPTPTGGVRPVRPTARRGDYTLARWRPTTPTHQTTQPIPRWTTTPPPAVPAPKRLLPGHSVDNSSRRCDWGQQPDSWFDDINDRLYATLRLEVVAVPNDPSGGAVFTLLANLGSRSPDGSARRAEFDYVVEPDVFTTTCSAMCRCSTGERHVTCRPLAERAEGRRMRWARSRAASARHCTELIEFGLVGKPVTKHRRRHHSAGVTGARQDGRLLLAELLVIDNFQQLFDMAPHWTYATVCNSKHWTNWPLTTRSTSFRG